jgi:hypothetical protein
LRSLVVTGVGLSILVRLDMSTGILVGRDHMKKRDELNDPGSCLSHAADDELVFVLLARDAAAPVAIRAWAEERIRLGKNLRADDQIREALSLADRMNNERMESVARRRNS